MTGSETRREILNIAILVVNQTLFMVAAITVMTLSGVVGGRLSDTPSLATLPIALTMVGAVVSTLRAPAGLSGGGTAGGIGRQPSVILVHCGGHLHRFLPG